MEVCLQIFKADNYIFNFVVHNNVVYCADTRSIYSFKFTTHTEHQTELIKFTDSCNKNDCYIYLTIINELLYSFTDNSDLGI